MGLEELEPTAQAIAETATPATAASAEGEQCADDALEGRDPGQAVGWMSMTGIDMTNLPQQGRISPHEWSTSPWGRYPSSWLNFLSICSDEASPGIPAAGHAMCRKPEIPPAVNESYVTTLITSPVLGAWTTSPWPMYMPM